MNIFKNSSQEDILEKKAALKYFYLINIDDVIDKIKKSNEYSDFVISDKSSSHIDSLFTMIFQTIINATNNYNSFLTVPGNRFFGENYLNPIDQSNTSTQQNWYSSAIYFLLLISLQNHCIIHGLLHNPIDIPSSRLRKKGQTSSNTIEICGAEHCFFEPDRRNHPINIAQLYNRKYGRKIPDSYYSQRVLKYIADNIAEHNKHIFVPPQASYFAFFLFYEETLQKFNREITKIHSHDVYNISLFDSYTTLCTKSAQHKMLFKDAYCKLLFDYPLEYYYGFSSMPYLSQCLEDIHNCVAADSPYPYFMKYLDSENLLDIFKCVLQLPNVYSRHFFIKYAIHAIINSTHLPLYMNSPSNTDLLFPEDISHEEFCKSHALPLLRKFVTTLTNLTIPLLENTWDVVMYELFVKNNLDIPLCELYKRYIEEYFSQLTADFTKLSTTEIYTFSDRSYFPDYKKIKRHTLNNILHKQKREPFHYYTLSKTTLRNIQQIMKSCFDINSNEDFCRNIPLPPLNVSNDMSRYSKSFMKCHTENIYNYLHNHD